MQTIKPEQKEFADIYIEYYPKLLRFAKEYVIRAEDAENVVQDVFMRLWDNREYFEEMVINANAYLFRLTKNRCIDHIKYRLSVEKHSKSVIGTELSLRMEALDCFDDSLMSMDDLEMLITSAIDDLPDKCREIFVLSRMKGLKYKEISDQLNISVNTVENQMSIALKKLRGRLKNYLPLLNFIVF